MSDGLLRMEELGSLVRKKRDKEGLSLRDAAQLAEVSFNTLSRVERGRLPDLDNFQRIVAWLGLPPERFFEPSRKHWEPTPELIAHHLRTDPDLTPEAADKIASIVEDLYSALARRDLAVHLRAAATFEPKAADLIVGLLMRMQERLALEGGKESGA